MPSEQEHPLAVEFTVKELLANINSTITRVEGKLDSKADRSDMARFDQRMSEVEKAVVRIDLEMHGDRRAQATLESWKRYRGPLIMGLIGTVILALATLLPLLLIH